MTDLYYDVVIAGGGPAGSAAALSLVCAGYSVAILERSDYTRPRVGETLPPSIKIALARLGLWDAFLLQCPARSPAVLSAWGSDRLQEQNHYYNPYGAGWHIDRCEFDRMIACAAQDAGAALITEARILSCERQDSHGWTIGYRVRQVQSSLKARLVIDATGRSAAVARQCGARRVVRDHLVGVFGFFDTASQERPAQITLVEAVENGWWYSASLPDTRLVVAWMTDADLYAQGGRHSAERWLADLGHAPHTRERAEGAALASRPWLVPANSSRLDQMHGANWLAAGDGAMAYDPLSGQGIYQALEGGMRATEAVQACLGGNPGGLAAYGAELAGAFEQYLVLRGRFYAQENRWAGSAFWSRRQNLGASQHRVSAA